MEQKYPPRYNIIKTESFIQKCHKLKETYARMPDLIKGIEWALMRKPHSFFLVSGEYYLWKAEQIDNQEIPQLRVLYKVDIEKNEVILLEIDD